MHCELIGTQWILFYTEVYNFHSHPIPLLPTKEIKEGHSKGYILSKEKTRLCCLFFSSIIVLVGSERFGEGWQERDNIVQRKDPKTVCTWRCIYILTTSRHRWLLFIHKGKRFRVLYYLHSDLAGNHGKQGTAWALDCEAKSMIIPKKSKTSALQ